MSNPKCWFGQMYKEDRYATQRITAYLKLIKPYLKSGSRLLDVGCYTAEIYDCLPKDIEYYGLDFDDEALKIASSKGAKVEKIRFDEEEIKLNNRFDIIIVAEILEHLKNPQELLKQLEALLDKNGIIIISLPNECTLFHRIMCFLGRGVDMYAFKLYKHLHLPTIFQSRAFVSIFFETLNEVYYINPSGKGSRWEGLGKITSKIPDKFWLCLANMFPGLFARGVIFLCKHKTNN